jgi:hypothetical protein
MAASSVQRSASPGLHLCGRKTCVVYDYNKCVQILVERDGMSEEGAREYLDFNSVGAWVGESGPLWMVPRL